MTIPYYLLDCVTSIGCWCYWLHCEWISHFAAIH